MRDRAVVRLADPDMAAGDLGQQAGPFQQGLMRVGARIGLAVDREGGAGHRLLRQDRGQLMRQGEITQPHRAHHVMHDAGVAAAQGGLRAFRSCFLRFLIG